MIGKVLSKSKIAAMLLTTLSGFALPAFALDRNSGDEIVVEGERISTETYKDLIDNRLRVTGGGRFNGQFARFETKICPAVFGLGKTNNKLIRKRIKSVALAADIPVAKDNCKPNVHIFAVDDGQKFIRLIRQKRHRLFEPLTIPARDKIMNGAGPVYGWKTSARVSYRTSGGVGSASDLGAPVGNNSASRIKVPFKIAMIHSFLIFDTAALAGLTTTQIGDFAAMSTLADFKFDSVHSPPAQSIFSLFQTSDQLRKKPQSIGESDLKLLSALYKTPSDVRAPLQRSAMLHRIAIELKADRDSAK